MEGGGDNFQGEGLDFSRTLTPWSLHTGAPCTPLPTHDAHEVRWLDEIFSIRARMKVCVTPPHFPPDPTERLLSPRTASTPRTQKAADGGQKSLESKDESEWTKQRKNCKIPEREQPTHNRVNAHWCGNNSPSTVHFSPENRPHNKLTRQNTSWSQNPA